MSTEKILILSAVAFLTSYLLTPWLKKISFKIGSFAVPNHRTMHTTPTSTGGGMAIFLGFLAAFLFVNRMSPQITGFIVGAFIIVILGIFDDILDLTALTKFIVQSLVAFILIYFGIRINVGTLLRGHVSEFSYLSIPLTYFWMIGVTNAINLIDGLDGLAAGVSTIAAFTISIVAFLNGQVTVAVLALIVAFAALGFLPHNLGSQIFMGDTGSMFLGYSLAVLSIMGTVKLAAAFTLFVPVMILAIPIFDTVFAIIRRIINHQAIYQGDKKHLHHRLIEMGLSPFQVVMIIYALSVLFGGMAILSATLPARQGYLLFTATLVIVVFGGWGLVIWHQRRTGS